MIELGCIKCHGCHGWNCNIKIQTSGGRKKEKKRKENPIRQYLAVAYVDSPIFEKVSYME